MERVVEAEQYDYDKNGNMKHANGHSTMEIRAKKTARTVNPRMELWIGSKQYMSSWNITETEYNTFTWNGLVKAGSLISLKYTNGSADVKLYVESVKANGLDLISPVADTEIAYQGDWHSDTNVSTLNRVIEYNCDNKVSKITEKRGGTTEIQTSLFYYDYAGSRIKKTETVNGETTTAYYFGAKYEEQYGSSTKTISYYFQNGQRIAQRTQIARTDR